MSQLKNELPVRVGFFDTAAQADRAIRDLEAAGFTQKEVAVICPEGLAGSCTTAAPQAEKSGAHATGAIMAGGAAGAALGGLALAAVAATGGGALLLAAPVLIGGGALAGGFSSLIATDGYDKGVGDYYDYAIRHKKIAVGVEVKGGNIPERVDRAASILTAAGAESMQPLDRTS